MTAAIALITDFGTRDGYVGAMKGVLLSRAPGAALIDVTHDIPRGDAAAAAHALAVAAPWFPEGSVHLVVVDPGVGSARRALALRAGSLFYVGPDNGVLGQVGASGEELRVHEIAAPPFAPPDASPVFHGRDIFARAAAHLARGGALDALGPALDPESRVRLSGPSPEREPETGIWRAVVVHVDHFGNLVTNLPLGSRGSDVPGARRSPGAEPGWVQIAGRRIALRRTYSDVASGELVALRGSSGQLEIACNGASAAERLGVARGAVVEFAPVAER